MPSFTLHSPFFPCFVTSNGAALHGTERLLLRLRNGCANSSEGAGSWMGRLVLVTSFGWMKMVETHGQDLP